MTIRNGYWCLLMATLMVSIKLLSVQNPDLMVDIVGVLNLGCSVWILSWIIGEQKTPSKEEVSDDSV